MMPVPTPADARFAMLIDPEVRTADDAARLVAELIRLCRRRGLPYDDCLGEGIRLAHEDRPAPSLAGLPAGAIFVRRFARGSQEMTIVSGQPSGSLFVRSITVRARPVGGWRVVSVFINDPSILFIGTKKDYLRALKAERKAARAIC